MDMLRTEWRWFSNEMLVVDEGPRPVVLGTLNRKLAMRDRSGCLVYFDPKSPVAHLIKSAPKMLVALEAARDEMESMWPNKVTLRLNVAYNGLLDAIAAATGQQ